MPLKIKPEHLATMRNACLAVVSQMPNARAEYKASGMSDRRFYWDVLWAAKVEGNSNRWICEVLYPYLNDSHIDSALAAILAA